MLRNYIVVALRNLWRSKTVSFINIAGLSIGLACCMLILLYVDDDWSFDRFHRHRDDIYRITSQVLNPDGTFRANSGWTSRDYGPSFKRALPEVEDYCRFLRIETRKNFRRRFRSDGAFHPFLVIDAATSLVFNTKKRQFLFS